jgi:hypothetical protein
MPAIRGLRRLRQEGCELEASLSYTARPVLKHTSPQKRKRNNYVECASVCPPYSLERKS